MLTKETLSRVRPCTALHEAYLMKGAKMDANLCVIVSYWKVLHRQQQR
jgi:hypothetical protein